MTVKLSTLVKDPNSMLADVFTGKTTVEKDSDGRYFIDCNGEVFTLILDYLRLGTIPKQDKASELYRYARIFKLQGLVEALEKYYPVQFENRMRNLFEGFGERKRSYEEIRNKALANIAEVNCYDNTLIPIVYILNDEQASCGKDHSFMVSSQLSTLGEVRTLRAHSDRCIPLQSLCVNDASNISKYLAYDLCELGYCKQGFYFDGLAPQNCRNRANCGFTWKLEFLFLSRSYEVEDMRMLKRP